MHSSLKGSPGHESPDPGPSALGDEEANNRVGHGAPGLTDEEHHGGLNGVNLQRNSHSPLWLSPFQHFTSISPERLTWATSSR